MNLLDFFITLAIKGDSAVGALDDVGKAADKAERQLDAARATADRTSSDIEDLGSTADAASSDINDLGSVADRTTSDIDDLGGAAKDAGKKAKSSGVDWKKVSVIFAAAGAAATAAATGLYALATSVANQMDSLRDFAALNNVAIEAVQELGHAALSNGASIDIIKSSLQGLNRIMGEVETGVGRGAKMFEEFGLSTRNSDKSLKTADQMLLDIADKMKDLSVQESIAMASKIGITPELVTMLRMGSEEIEKTRARARELGIVSTETAAQTASLMQAQKDMALAINTAKVTIGAAVSESFAPLVLAIAEGIAPTLEMIKESGHLDKIIKVLGGVTIIAVIGALGAMAIALVAVYSKMFIATAAAWKFTVALLANPMTWIVLAIVAAVALLAYSVYQLVNNWDAVKAAIMRFVDSAKSKIAELWAAVVAKFNDMVASAKAVGTSIGDAFRSAFDAVKNAISSVFSYFTSIDWLAPIRPMLNVLAKLPSMFGGATAAAGAAQQSQAARSTATFPIVGKSGGNQDNRNISVTVNAGTNASPQKIADTTSRAVGNMRLAQ